MKILQFIGSIFVCYLPGIIGSLFSPNGSSLWYELLIKPSFTPPGWVFAPVWTVLYLLMGVSLFLVLKASGNFASKLKGLIFFAIQLVLNASWSVMFFGKESILAGLLIILALLVFIVLSIVEFYKIFKPAAYLLIPYLLWTTFAFILNFSLYRLN